MLRFATYNDLQVIHSYAPIVLKESTGSDILLESSPALPYLSNLVSMNKARYIVFEEQHQIAGWILYGEGEDILERKAVGYLYEIFVLHHYRNRGIAKILMTEAMNQLIYDGYEVIKLNAFVKNSARSFYERMGFSTEQIQMRWDKMTINE